MSAEVTPANLQEYITRVFSRAHIETLVHGNMLKDEALALSKLAETTIDAQPLTLEELRSHRALIVPEGTLDTQRLMPDSARARC